MSTVSRDPGTGGETDGGVEVGRGSGAVFSGILLSRVSGLFREALVRGTLGLGTAASAYTAALRIPNLLQNMLGSGVLSASFIPVYSGLVDDDRERAGVLASTVAAFLVAVTGILVTLGVIFADPITSAVAWRLPPDAHVLTVRLVRIMTPGIGLLALSAWSLGVLNSHRRFFLSYVAPVLTNILQISVVIAVTAAVFTKTGLAVAVAWAVTAGGLLQFAVQLPAVLRVNPHIGVRTDFGDPAFRDFLRRLGPVLVGRGSVQIAAFLDLGLASLLAISALAALGAAQVLYLLPVALFALSVAAAELPEIARTGVGQVGELARRTREGLMQIGFFVTFIAVTYVFAGPRVVGTVFDLLPISDLSDDEVLLISLVLGSYSLGLIGVSASRFLQNVFYGIGDSVTPARYAVVRFTFALTVGLLIMFQFDRFFLYNHQITGFGQMTNLVLRPLPLSIRENQDLPLRLGAVALALASALGAWVEFGLLRRSLLRRFGLQSLTDRHWRRLVPPSITAAVLLVGLGRLTSSLPTGVDMVAAVGPAGLAYLLLAARARVPAAERVLRTAMRRPSAHRDNLD